MLVSLTSDTTSLYFNFCNLINFNQFKFLQNAGGDDDENDGNEEDEPTPGVMDYIMHFLTLFWKIVFAFIPPTGTRKQI